MSEPRKVKICPYCSNCVPGTENCEPECELDNDVESEDYCDDFDRTQ